MLYKFDYTDSGTQTHDFGVNFGAPILTLGGPAELKFLRPFGETAIYQVGNPLPTAQAFLVQGSLSGATALDDLATLDTRLATCIKLYRTDDAGANGVYVECEAASSTVEDVLSGKDDDKATTVEVDIEFWPKYYVWKLVSDDSETII